MFREGNVLVQGITGKEGARITKDMLAYGTPVSCGVTPGKGGQEVEGVPVFNTIQEAKTTGEITTSLVVVPPQAVKAAVEEALDEGIKQVLIVTENVPILDMSFLLAKARRVQATILGATSVGLMKVDTYKIGPIGGAHPDEYFTKGAISIVSKSGGLSAETARILSKAGIGQRYVISVGGDTLMGTSLKEAVDFLDKDEGTKGIIVIGEVGGKYEEELAQHMPTKPVAAFILGLFASTLKRGLAVGHAGAILEPGAGSAEEKKEILKAAGASVVDIFDDIPQMVKSWNLT